MEHFVDIGNLYSKEPSYLSKVCEQLDSGDNDAVVINFPMSDYDFQVWKYFLTNQTLHELYYVYLVFTPMKKLELDFDCMVIDTNENPRASMVTMEECFERGIFGFSMSIVVSLYGFEALRPNAKAVFLTANGSLESLERMGALRLLN